MLQCISPVDASIYVERPYAADDEIAQALARSVQAGRAWRTVALEERAAACTAFVDAFIAQADETATELAWQMGRPIRYGKGEVGGFEEPPIV